MAVSSGGGASGRAGAVRAGEAFVQLTTRDAGLRAGLNNARKLVVGFAKAMATLTVALGAAALGGIIASFREMVRHLDRLNDAAERLGATTEDLSALGYAAEQSGSNFEEMAAAAKFLQRNLIENEKQFERFGLDAAKLRKMGLADQFQAVADAIDAVEDPAEKTAAAMALMGRGGATMLPMMRELAKLRGEAGLVGAVVGGKDAKDAARVADALDRVWTSLKNTFRAFGALLLPVADDIIAVADGIVLCLKAMRDFTPELIKTIGAWLDMQVSGTALGSMLKFLGETFRTTWTGMKDAIASGDLVLAFDIAAAGIEVVWAQLMVTLQKTWNQFKEGVVDGWHLIITEIKIAYVEAIQLIARNLREMMPKGAAGRFAADQLGGLLGQVMNPDEVRAQGNREQAARDAARALAQLAVNGDLAAAQLKLAALNAQALNQRWGMAAGVVAVGAMGAALRQRRDAAAAAMFGASRGAFAGRGIGGELAAAGASIEEKQLEEQKKGNGLLADIKDKVGGLAVD